MIFFPKSKPKNKILTRIRKCTDAVRKSELEHQLNTLKNDITHLTRAGKKDYHKNNLLKIKIISTKSGKALNRLSIFSPNLSSSWRYYNQSRIT